MAYHAMLFGFIFRTVCINHLGFSVAKQNFKTGEVILQHSRKFVLYFLNNIFDMKNSL